MPSSGLGLGCAEASAAPQPAISTISQPIRFSMVTTRSRSGVRAALSATECPPAGAVWQYSFRSRAWTPRPDARSAQVGGCDVGRGVRDAGLDEGIVAFAALAALAAMERKSKKGG